MWHAVLQPSPFSDDTNSIVKAGLKNYCNAMTRQTGNIIATIWQDTKPVTILSTNTQATTPVSVQRRSTEDGSHKDVSCPEAIVLYNKYMGGVDKGLITWKKTVRKTEGTPTTNYF